MEGCASSTHSKIIVKVPVYAIRQEKELKAYRSIQPLKNETVICKEVGETGGHQCKWNKSVWGRQPAAYFLLFVDYRF